MADPLLNPSEIDFDASPVDFALAQRRWAQSQAVQSLDDSADDAGRADQMARATGAHPALVYGDLENFENQYKATLTSNILEHNQYLRDYVASHPLAAKVSNDDWGQLDSYTGALSKVLVGKDMMSLASMAMKGFKEGWDADGFGQEFDRTVHNLLGNGAIANTFLNLVKVNPAYYAPRIMQGLLYAGAKAGPQFLYGQTGNEAMKERATRDLLIVPQVAIPELAGGAIPVELNAIAQAARKGEPWAKMGRFPHPGYDPDSDAIHKEQVKLDMDKIDEAHKELQSSSTIQRSPELASLVGRIVTDGKIDLSAEAVRKLYGGKPGEPIEVKADDKLGFIPNLQEQLALAEKYGGDVSVPLSEWNARSGDLHDELREFIRPRADGMSLADSKLEGPKVEEPIGAVEPVDALRQNAGLASAFPPKEELITLGRMQDTKILVPTDRWTENEANVLGIVQDYLKKVAPQTETYFATGARKVEVRGREVRGAYVPGQDKAAILYALHDPKGNFVLPDQMLTTVRHELMHYLWRNGFLDDSEKQTLTEAATRENWLGRHYIEERYPGADKQTKLEEAIADEFGKWHESGATAQARAESRAIFQKIRDMLLAIREAIIKALGVDPKVTDLFSRIESGEVGARKPGEGGGEAAAMAPELTPGSPLDIENRIRGLMPKGLLDRYMEKIGKQQEEDAAFQEKQARKRAEETQTKEWKQSLGEMKDKVRGEMQNRADIAADRLFRIGQIFGKKVGKVTLDPKYLTDEQKAALPKEYIGKGGENPDAIAAPFGYTTGDQLVTALARIKAEREMEGLTPQAHFNKLVDAETDRRMRLEHGTLDEAIVKEMEDHVISPTQFDLLHDKMLALGMAAKTNEPLESLPNMRLAIKEAFARSDWQGHSSAKYTAASLRAFGRLRDAALKDDIYGMFKAQQEQIHALMLADEAKKLEKENARDDRLFKKYAQRAPTGVDPETANFIQDILERTFGVMRSREDLLRQRSLISTHKNLEDFVQGVNSRIWADPNQPTVGQRMPVASFLLNPDYRQDPAKMTVEEKRAVATSIRTMDKYAKETNTYEVKGKKEALEDVRDGLVNRLKAAVNNKKINVGPEQATSAFRTVGSWLLTPETWFNRLDLFNARGPFNQLVLRPIIEGQYTLKTLQRKYASEWKEIGDPGDLRKKIDNPLFKDTDGSLLQLNKGHVLSILSNMGNKVQRLKLAGGYGIDNPDKIWNWLFSLVDQGILSKEDFARAGKMGDFFSRIFSDSEKMYSSLSGVTPERIPLGTIKTPWGDMPEWYHPLIRNSLKSSPLRAADMFEESGYYKPATATGYTKQRTGAIYPLQLNFDAIPKKVQEMLNDIAMHQPITDVSKILLDRKFKDAFAQYYGKEYASALEPWLKDSAGQGRYTSPQEDALNTAVRYMQENMSTLMIGFNIGTVGKHAPTALAFSMREVGAKRFLNAMTHILSETPEGKSWYRFAMDTSEELQNRLRWAAENMSGTNKELFQRYNWGHQFFRARDIVQTIGALPVAMSDFASAVPMWVAAYQKFMEENPGALKADAVYDANRAVRRTHGSTIIANRPAIMRMNPFVSTFMPFYNFFNNAANRLYEFSAQAKLSAQGRTLPEMTGFEKEQFNKGFKRVPEVLGGFLVFGVLVSLIEQAIDPLKPDPDHPIKQGAKIISRGPLSMVPGLRDVINGAYGGKEPSAGLMGTIYRDVAEPLTKPEHIADPNRSIKMLNNFWGAMTGLTYAPVGNVGQYIHSIETGREVPHNPIDVLKGYRFGTQREFKR